ncbi:MAG: hypothetical protein PHD48_06310 [Alphaproteobacteria bacterium]|nr:hypothetical protein [Alphaproteobacteria bacterium]
MDKHDLNFLLIPGELADPKMRAGIDHQDAGREQAMYDRSFSCVMPTDKTAAPLAKTRTAAPSSAAPSKDYLKTYREKQRAGEEAARKNVEATQKIADDKEQRVKDTELRVRAKALGDQIRYWNGEHAKSNHDAQTIQGNISALQRDLSAIDGRYWN